MASLGCGHCKKNILFLWVLIPLFCIHMHSARGQSLRLYGQQIKTGLIYNFLKYIEWPPVKAGISPPPLVVCIFGLKDPFEGYLLPLEGRTVSQRTITIRHVTEVEETSNCHLLFVNASEKESWPELHDFLANKSILTVGDFPGFLDVGGMIQFDDGDGRVRITLNTRALRTARLHMYKGLQELAATSVSDSGKIQ